MAARGQRWLVATGVLFAVGSAVHMVDHLRRGQGSVTDALYWAGNVALIMQVTTVVLVLTRHRLAPVVALATGFPLALGFFAAHWVPEWGTLSDPLWDVGSWSWFSYAASTLEIVGALAVGVAGYAVVRKQGLASFATARPSGPPTKTARSDMV